MSQLVDRFTYGNGFLPTPQERAIQELIVDSPARQRAMISLAEKQIAAQQQAAREIIASNIEGSRMVAAEIEQQTEIIERGMGQLADAIGTAADQVSNAINHLGDRLCIELAEIRWELAQMGKTLEDILNTLQENRNNETRQLVRQGIRHYTNGEYEEAENRFRMALDFDTTDYQVLMNLGYIEIHKNQAKEAFTFFRKALNLPENLDTISKSRTLWAIARLHYAQGEYDQALNAADQSVALDASANPKKIFTLGIYAALDGQSSRAIRYIDQAIRLAPALFATAAVEPDLDGLRKEIWKLLSRLSSEAIRDFEAIHIEVRDLTSEVNSNNKRNDEYHDFLSWTQRKANDIAAFKRNSYSDYVYSIQDSIVFRHSLKECPKIIHDIDQYVSQTKKLDEKKTLLQRKIKDNQTNTESAKKKLKLTREISRNSLGSDNTLPTPLAIILYLMVPIPYIIVASFASNSNEGILMKVVGFLLWPIVLLGLILGAIFGEKTAKYGVLLILFGLACVIFIIFIVRKTSESRKKSVDKSEMEVASAHKELGQLNNEFGTAEIEIKQIRNKIINLTANLAVLMKTEDKL